VGATTAANVGTLDITHYRHDIVSVNTTAPYATVEWAHGNSGFPLASSSLQGTGNYSGSVKCQSAPCPTGYNDAGANVAGCSGGKHACTKGGPLDEIVSFDTPIGASNYCGRVVLPMMHVTTFPGTDRVFPSECSGLSNTLSSQEKAFEYMFFQS